MAPRLQALQELIAALEGEGYHVWQDVHGVWWRQEEEGPGAVALSEQDSRRLNDWVEYRTEELTPLKPGERRLENPSPFGGSTVIGPRGFVSGHASHPPSGPPPSLATPPQAESPLAGEALTAEASLPPEFSNAPAPHTPFFLPAAPPPGWQPSRQYAPEDLAAVGLAEQPGNPQEEDALRQYVFGAKLRGEPAAGRAPLAGEGLPSAPPEYSEQLLRRAGLEHQPVTVAERRRVERAQQQEEENAARVRAAIEEAADRDYREQQVREERERQQEAERSAALSPRGALAVREAQRGMTRPFEYRGGEWYGGVSPESGQWTTRTLTERRTAAQLEERRRTAERRYAGMSEEEVAARTQRQEEAEGGRRAAGGGGRQGWRGWSTWGVGTMSGALGGLVGAGIGGATSLLGVGSAAAGLALSPFGQAGQGVAHIGQALSELLVTSIKTIGVGGAAVIGFALGGLLPGPIGMGIGIAAGVIATATADAFGAVGKALTDSLNGVVQAFQGLIQMGRKLSETVMGISYRTGQSPLVGAQLAGIEQAFQLPQGSMATTFGQWQNRPEIERPRLESQGLIPRGNGDIDWIREGIPGIRAGFRRQPSEMQIPWLRAMTGQQPSTQLLAMMNMPQGQFEASMRQAEVYERNARAMQKFQEVLDPVIGGLQAAAGALKMDALQAFLPLITGALRGITNVLNAARAPWQHWLVDRLPHYLSIIGIGLLNFAEKAIDAYPKIITFLESFLHALEQAYTWIQQHFTFLHLPTLSSLGGGGATGGTASGGIGPLRAALGGSGTTGSAGGLGGSGGPGNAAAPGYFGIPGFTPMGMIHGAEHLFGELPTWAKAGIGLAVGLKAYHVGQNIYGRGGAAYRGGQAVYRASRWAARGLRRRIAGPPGETEGEGDAAAEGLGAPEETGGASWLTSVPWLLPALATAVVGGTGGYLLGRHFLSPLADRMNQGGAGSRVAQAGGTMGLFGTVAAGAGLGALAGSIFPGLGTLAGTIIGGSAALLGAGYGMVKQPWAQEKASAASFHDLQTAARGYGFISPEDIAKREGWWKEGEGMSGATSAQQRWAVQEAHKETQANLQPPQPARTPGQQAAHDQIEQWKQVFAEGNLRALMAYGAATREGQQQQIMQTRDVLSRALEIPLAQQIERRVELGLA